MSAFWTDLSPSALAAAVEENLFASCPLVFGTMPNAEIYDGPDMLRCATGIPSPMLNNVCRARFTPEETDARIAEALAFFRERRLPFLWWNGPSTQPVDLHSHLENAGVIFRADIPGMAVTLDCLTPDPASAPGMKVVEVENSAMLAQWAEACSRGFEMPAFVADAMQAGAATIGFGADKPMRNFLALKDGAPVACSSLCLGAGTAGIYCVATVPEARRQGFGAAAVVMALRAAQELGYHIGILQSSTMGFPVYRRLGFEQVCTFATYSWKPESEDQAV